MNRDALLQDQGTEPVYPISDYYPPRIRSLANHLINLTERYLNASTGYGNKSIASMRLGFRDRALEALSAWIDEVGSDPLAKTVESLLCSPAKMLQESLVQLEAADSTDPDSVFSAFGDTISLLCDPKMDLTQIPAPYINEAVSIIHNRALGLLRSLVAGEFSWKGWRETYGSREGVLADWFLLHARLMGAFAHPFPIFPGNGISQAEYGAYTSALRSCKATVSEGFPPIFAATWAKYQTHPMWNSEESDSMAGGFNPITGTYNESAPQKRPPTNPRGSMSARKRSYLDSLTAAPIPSDQCDSQEDAVPALPDPNPDPDPTKKEAPMAAPAAETPKAGSVTVIEEVRLNPGDSYFSAVFSMLKLGGSTALAAKMSDGMATLIMERLPRALPFLEPLLMIPGISKAFALASPPLIGWLCHNRYIPKMFLSEQKQNTLAVWCLLATLGQTNKFLYDLGDDLMGKLWKSMRDILEDEDEALLKKTIQVSETSAS